MARCERLQALQRAFDAVLPPELSGQVRVADLHGGEMRLTTQSSAWANRLRFMTPTLLAQTARSDLLHGVQRLLISVDAPPVAAPPRRHAPRIPRAAADLLEAAARDVAPARGRGARENDGPVDPLAAGLQRLARRARGFG